MSLPVPDKTWTVLVTGASSGIGRATAERFAVDGHRVIGTSRNPDSVADPLPGVDYVALDLDDPASIEACAAAAGEVDILVNNAGESQVGALEDLPPDELEHLFRVNVLSAVRLTQLVLPGMRERGRGRVVMVGSMLASFPLAYRSSYVAAKAALKGFADAARGELAPYGIGMTTVEPGSINTGISQRRTIYAPDGSPYAERLRVMLGHLDRNERRGISAGQVAETIATAVMAPKPKPLYAVGSNAPLVFALRRLAPTDVVHAMVARKHGL